MSEGETDSKTSLHLQVLWNTSAYRIFYPPPPKVGFPIREKRVFLFTIFKKYANIFYSEGVISTITPPPTIQYATRVGSLHVMYSCTLIPTKFLSLHSTLYTFTYNAADA